MKKLFKKKGGEKVESGGLSARILASGIILGLTLIVYVILSIAALAEDMGTAFADYVDLRSGPLEYDFDSFEIVFPGELDRLDLEISARALAPETVEVNTATTTNTTTTTDTSTSTPESSNSSSSVDDTIEGV